LVERQADGDDMTDWWIKIVAGGEGNVIRERAFTNWNTFDASKILEEKEREKASSVQTSVEADAASNRGNTERD
jgi:hypothetical protein